METRYIKRIGILSLGKVLAVLYAIMGLLVALFLNLLPMPMSSMMHSPVAGGPLFGTGAIIALPIIYGVMGFIAGIIIALVFNIASGMIGGLEVEIE